MGFTDGGRQRGRLRANGMWIGVGKGKGGSGCTTTALELAYAATQRHNGPRRRRVAVIGLDPQGDATAVLEPASRRVGIKDALQAHGPGAREPLPLADVLVPTAWEGVLVAPADRFLANREVDITTAGIGTLRRARIDGELDGLVDDVIIDLPRDLGKLSATGLLGMEHLFITARATVWSAQGAEEMRYTAQRIAEKGNPELTIAGVIVTGFEETEDSRRVLGEIRNRFGSKVLEPPVPRSPRVPEALESYHTPCREFGGDDLKEVGDIYQHIYDSLPRQESAS
ncbi:ParA family protein [Streptomyces sp. Ac-502]|uniref:ParA family protein n=1 Tax=Streptomyces sp. Ac-502 TaxID=3342801 RepID=UPI003862A225